MRRHGSRIQSRRIAETYLHRSIGTALKGLRRNAAYVDRLERLAGKYPAPRPCAWSEIEWHHKLARAHLLGEQARPDEAIAILQQLQREAEAMQHRQFLICVAIRLSAVQLGAGKGAEAADRFHRVLTACAAAGVY